MALAKALLNHANRLAGSVRCVGVQSQSLMQEKTNWASLQHKVVVVPGATGAVGESIVRSLLRNGATVFACGCTQNKLDDLLNYVAGVHNENLYPVN